MRETHRDSMLGVSFADCSELASITTINVAQARSVVPASFTLSGDATGAPFVVRVAHCRAVSIDGSVPEAGSVAQLGVSIVSPDGTGAINNYTAWYYTTSHALAQGLRRRGIPARWLPRLGYDLASNPGHTGGALNIDVPGRPAFAIDAAVVEPVTQPVQFTANWWTQVGPLRTKMSTPIPALRFGTAATTLRTAPGSRLDHLLGASTTTFPLLDTFNRFATAQMTVSVSRSHAAAYLVCSARSRTC